MSKQTLAFIGAGNMASSLIGGLIADNYPAERIWASNPHQELLDSLQQRYAIHADSSNLAVAKQADVLIIAVKPHVLTEVLTELKPVIEQQQPLLISIAAGIREQDIQNMLDGNTAIIRCMPNTPALVGSGATALYANQYASQAQKNVAESIVRAVGIAQWIEHEPLMDVVTALSGSGPAYFFLLMEALEAAAVQQGLPSDAAHLLTLQTALGAAHMAMQSTNSCAELRAQVTSPGGTTEAALEVLESAKIRDLFNDAVKAATTRAQDLAEMLASNNK